MYRSFFFFFSSRRRHTRCLSDWSSDVCSSDLDQVKTAITAALASLLQNVSLIVVYVAILIGLSWRLTLVALVCAPRSEERRVGKSVDLGGGSRRGNRSRKRKRKGQIEWMSMTT